ncbi:MAG: DUF5916 domain-containing protein [Bacteroidota bacterium]
MDVLKLFSFLIISVILIPLSLEGQTELKQLSALRIEEPPKIDGNVDEPIWQSAVVATDFIENNPNPFDIPEQQTEVRILYDDKAIYIAAIMHDPDGKVLKQFSIRDEIDVNADKFEFHLDPFLKGQNSWMYGVTAAGVQFDAFITPSGSDISWDGVWTSAVSISKDGWRVEMRIPYSAIRFPDRDIQTWGVNFKRDLRRTREISYWNPIDPEKDGFANQFGILTGIEKVKPPVRLSFTPFLVTYHKHFPNDDRDVSSWEHEFSGGLDLKYGINESLTLDMSIIPDFGQVPFDELELNLSPFELRFDENRPFFTEGTEIFSRANIFYSKRVGGRPINFNAPYDDLMENEQVIDNPEKAQILNALKLSGRNRKGLGVGFFNAITSKTFATIEFGEGIFREVQTDPLTNYNVVVVDQQLPNNSYLSFINTNVIRGDGERDANVTAAEFRLANKKNTYAFNGKAAISQIFTKDEDGVNGQSGYAYNLGFSKISGNFIFDVSRNVENDKYYINDLGFLFNNNEISHSLNVNYRILKPFGIFNNFTASTFISHQALYEPRNEFSMLWIRPGVKGLFKNWFFAGVWANILPVNGYDFFEPRAPGEKFRIPPSYEVETILSSDYRKTIAFDSRLSFRKHPEWGRIAYSASLTPRIRVSDRLFIVPGVFLVNRIDDRGFTTIDSTSNIIFAKRDRRDITTTLEATYLFSNKMSISLEGRHNWALVENKEFFNLDTEGDLNASNYEGDHDINFNVFDINLVYRYRFAPGSEINLVWKNSIFSQNSVLNYNYFENFSDIFKENAENVFSIKILYYLDYLKIQRTRR